MGKCCSERARVKQLDFYQGEKARFPDSVLDSSGRFFCKILFFNLLEFKVLLPPDGCNFRRNRAGSVGDRRRVIMAKAPEIFQLVGLDAFGYAVAI